MTSFALRSSDNALVWVKDAPENEIWKDIPGYEGLYQISNLGNIKSITRRSSRKDGRNRQIIGKVLTQSISNGYYSVGLCLNNIWKLHKVHRLLAICFIENPNRLPHINHINENRLDNRLENLEWVSPRGNVIRYHSGKHKLPVGVVRNRFPKPGREYIASIWIGTKKIQLGVYPTPELARERYITELKKIGEQII